MAHELNLEAVAKKSDQLNALLFQLNAERISGQPEIESLIGLAYELSGDISVWLIEENAQRDNAMNNTKLKESACDELIYATSILNIIINDNVMPSDNMFNAIESAVANIERAKGHIYQLNIGESHE